GDIPALDLPADFIRPETPGFAGRRLDFFIGKEQTQGLKDIAAEAGATLYMVLLALFNLWLAKLSGRKDIIIGTAVEGRGHEDVKDIVGMFVNTLPLRNYPAGEKTFREFLAEVKERTTAALEKGDYPFENMVEKLNLDRDMNRNPLFDVLFHLINFDIPAAEMAGLRLTPYQFESRGSKFDLSLGAIESDDGLIFPVEYFTALFKRETVERFMGYFKIIVSQVLQDSGKKIKDIEILSGEEREKILVEFNDTAAAYTETATIHGLFEETVQNRPGTTAVVFEERHLTYFELNEAADRWSASLKKRGAAPGAIAAILIERSPEMIAGLFAILKTGGAYLPIDPAYPLERIEFMLTDSRAGILLTTRDLIEEVKELKSSGVETVFIEKTSSRVGAQNSVTEPTPPFGHPSEEGNSCGAYIIYTSGSTGRPKGVAVAHRSIVNTLQWRRNYYRFDFNDVVLQLPSFSFDSSVEDIFTSLISGSKLVLIRHEQRLETQFLKTFIKKRCITHFLIVPGLYKRYITEISGSLRSLRSVTLAGESFSRELVEEHFEKLPHVRLVNEYGPTENSVCATVYEFTQEKTRVLIGAAIHNVKCYVLDKNREPVPLGVTGELCVSGKGVAKGYLNRPELTAEKFASGPTAWGTTGVPEGRGGLEDGAKRSTNHHSSFINHHSDLIYKTGDLVRWLADGDLEFIGRIDDQVKIRGFRIEPGEVENRLKRVEQIKDAVITLKEEKNGEKRLYAYIIPAADFELPTLRRNLGRNLPAHMLPSRFFEIDRIPLTTNGKIDRQALDSLGRELDSGSDYVAPQGEKEILMADVCREVFGLEKIGVNDNFFDIGADSFAIMRLNDKLQDVFDREIPVLTYFEYPTIASFLDYRQHQETGRGISPAAEAEVREEKEWLESQKKGRDKIRKLRKKRVDDEGGDF
ncbi:MAG: amino acid adenylation domain-containing protein, partial [Candidatus Aminicenantes bacterium]|nr:amino acid adenylation domain-containing protein [Candidatus Aminicenantes bacterium]